jgi:hypothetical protein
MASANRLNGGDNRRRLDPLVHQGDRRLGKRVGLPQQGSNAVQFRIPPAGLGPPGREVVPGLVKRADHGLVGGGELRRPGRAQHAGQGAVDLCRTALLRGQRRGQPAGNQQQDRPSHAGQQQQRRQPPWPRRAERPGPQDGVNEELQPGDGQGGPGRGQHRGQPGHQDQHENRDPAPAVHQDAEQQPGRSAE